MDVAVVKTLYNPFGLYWIEEIYEINTAPMLLPCFLDKCAQRKRNLVSKNVFFSNSGITRRCQMYW